LARYEVLETYARTQLLPYDFTLTPQQERILLAKVRTLLEQTPDDGLFSMGIRGKIEEVVDAQIQPWRNENYDSGRAERLQEIRRAAPDYVSAFLADPENASTVTKITLTFGTDDLSELEVTLRRQIEDWINTCDDRLIDQCNVVTVKDIVFAQLRSWC
jgi:hypothetical protein